MKKYFYYNAKFKYLKDTLVTWFQSHLKNSQSSGIFIKEISYYGVYSKAQFNLLQKGYVVNDLVVVCY